MIKLTIFGTYGNMPDYPPPPSSFLVYTSLALFSFAIPGKRGARQIESSSSTTVTSADFFNPQCQLFVANFDDSRPHWYRSGTVINQLFPDFRGIRNRGKDVWQILEFNPIVFWYDDGWDCRSNGGKSLSWRYCAEAPAAHAKNRQETPLHSRRSQSRPFGHNLVAAVPKIACTSPYVSGFKKYRCRRNYLPYRPSSNLKFQTLHVSHDIVMTRVIEHFL